ncbi:Uncharacterised protein [Mycobacteroides abscessus]|nr:Uncharacterised protein [Mycobacteroides abscessus]
MTAARTAAWFCAARRRWSARRSFDSSSTTEPPRPRVSSTRNVMRRCAGRRASCSGPHASSGMTTSRSARTARVNATWNGSAMSPARAMSSQAGVCSRSQATTSRATSGAGTSWTRTGLGSERIVAVASSSSRPGTIQSNPSGTTRLSTEIGTCTVTPSASVPGWNW